MRAHQNTPAERLEGAEIAAALAAALRDGDVIHAAPGEMAALAVHRALQVACPDALCVLVTMDCPDRAFARRRATWVCGSPG